MRDDSCKEHNDPDCTLCDKYILKVLLFNNKSSEMSFWIGQNAGMLWGPMGMEDEVSVKFVAGETASMS